MSFDDVPMCPICRTQTIAALHGQCRCTTCDRVWDGTESGPVDMFPGLQTRNDPAAVDAVMGILEHFMRRGIVTDDDWRKATHGN